MKYSSVLQSSFESSSVLKKHVFLKSKVDVIRLMLGSAETDTELLHASFFSPIKFCLGRDCNILRSEE